MARSELQDPLDKFRWTVDIQGFSRFGFSSVQTPSVNVNTKKYPEGGSHLHPRVIIDSVSYGQVTLTRGVTNDTSFNKWATGFIDLVTNNAAVNNDGSLSAIAGNLGFGGKNVETYNPGKQYRRDVTIRHVNRVGQTVVTYILYNAFPVVYKPASDFNANDDEGFSIETLVLEYEGFDVKYAGVAGMLADIAANKLIT